jgi:hypothetical protein
VSKFPNHKNNISLYFSLNKNATNPHDPAIKNKILNWCEKHCKSKYNLLISGFWVEPESQEVYSYLEFWFESQQDKLLFTLVWK